MQESAPGSTHAYRSYFLDGDDHIAKRIDLETTSDEDARALACQLLDAQSFYPAIEVWDGARRVLRLLVVREQV